MNQLSVASIVMALLAFGFIGRPTDLLSFQVLNPSPQQILSTARPLGEAEIAAILAGVRRALDGRSFRLSYVPGGPALEFLMGADGRQRLLRTVHGENGLANIVTVTEFTRSAARSCAGASLGTELVIEYEQRGADQRWTAKARSRNDHEIGSAIFDILTAATPVRSVEWKTGSGPRALVAAWNPRGAASESSQPGGATQSLWIDTQSLLPARWTISMPNVPEYAIWFNYDEPIVDLRSPEGVARPTCIP